MEVQDLEWESQEVSVVSSAAGAESSAREQPQDTLATPASFADLDVETGLQNISYDFDSWKLLQKTVSDEQESLQSFDPCGVLFPCEKGEAGAGEPATLEPLEVHHVQEAPSSSGVRLMAETLTMDAPKHFWEQDPFLRAMFGRGRLTDVLLGAPLVSRGLLVVQLRLRPWMKSHLYSPGVQAAWEGAEAFSRY